MNKALHTLITVIGLISAVTAIADEADITRLDQAVTQQVAAIEAAGLLLSAQDIETVSSDIIYR